MKFWPSGKFYLIEEDSKPIIMETNLFDLDIDENFTIGQMKAVLDEKLIDTNLYEKVKDELEIRGVKTLPPDSTKVSAYKFYTYKVYGKKKA